MSNKRRINRVFAVEMVASMVLAACTTAQPVIHTVIVTQEVTIEAETTIEPQDVVFTPTPAMQETRLPPATTSPEFKNPDTIVFIDSRDDQETLDPAWTYGNDDTRGGAIEANIYEGLVFYDRDQLGSYIPALAIDWETTEDGLTWIFSIREGVKFHQGGTLEPHDIAYTNHRAMLQGRTDGPHWMTWEALFGPEFARASVADFAAEMVGKESFDDLTDAELVSICEAVKKVVVPDDEAGTVTYHLANPTPWFLALLAQNFLGGVTDMEWMIKNGDWDNDCATWQNWADPAAQDTILFNQANGTGPYMLDYWSPGEETVLVAFEEYWRSEPMWEGGPSGPARIKRVILKNASEWHTGLSMLESGDADWIDVPPQFFSQVEPNYKSVCQIDGSCEEGNRGFIEVYAELPKPVITAAQMNWSINFDGGNPFVGSSGLDGNGIPADFFSDINIRKAFNYCFDYDALIRAAIDGSGRQAQGPIPEGMLGYRESEAPIYSYDPDKCEEEFKLADVDKDGIAAGEDEDDIWKKGFYLQIPYDIGNETRRIASEIIKAGVESVNPKFNIAVVGIPRTELADSRRAGKLPIYVGGWFEDYHDPHNWVFAFMHSAGSYGRIVNMPAEIASEFDALVEEGALLATLEDRRQIYEEIQLKSQEVAVNIWLYQLLERYHFQEWINGFYYNPAYYEAYMWIYALSKAVP